jgi:putative peptide zinc metalloprotease protein
LFTPPILIPVLVAIVGDNGWLYFVQGNGDAIRAGLYTPGIVPLSLLVLIAANVLHEFGHAARLRYSFGEVRGMGAAVYVIWPMRYTDVTDSYRHSRRDRLRVDLGGVYFHLIAALSIVVLCLITGHEYPFTTVLLILIQVVRNSCLSRGSTASG